MAEADITITFKRHLDINLNRQRMGITDHVQADGFSYIGIRVGANIVGRRTVPVLYSSMFKHLKSFISSLFREIILCK